MFLDVVYNHFGPDGNYLARSTRPASSATTSTTPWGAAIDFRAARRCAASSSRTRSTGYRISLRRAAPRRRARHRRRPTGSTRWRPRCAPPSSAGRHVHLVLENDDNAPDHLRRGFDAQWNDDAHHVLHVLLTGERDGYYADYATRRPTCWRAAWPRASPIRASARPIASGKPRGAPSGDLPPTAFVLFLQNHDQIGNRAFGDRLTELVDPEALRGRHRPAASLSAGPAAVHGRGEGEPHAVPLLHRPSRRAGQGRARGPAARVRGLRGLPAGETTDAIPDPNAAQTFDCSRPAAGGERAPADRHSTRSCWRCAPQF